MRKKYQLSYLFLYVLTPLFQVQLSSTFPKNIEFSSSLKGQAGENPSSEILSEAQDERRNNNPNLIRKKRSLNSSNEIAARSQIQSDNSNKNPYVRRKRDFANNQDKSEKETNDTDFVASLNGVKDDIEKEDTEEEDTEEEDTEEKKDEQENLKRSKRESDQNTNVNKNLTKREVDYEESINDDDSNTQEKESEEDESESRNENRVKRNEEDSERDYEKELKSKADVNNEENFSEKEESRKESLHEKRHLEPNSKNQKIQRKNNENSGDSREEVDNSKIDLRLDSDQELGSSQNLESDEKLTYNVNSKFDHSKELEADKKSDKKEDSEMNGYIDLEVKEDESEDDYEKRVAEQIQQKIDAIKEKIKREIEEKRKIEEIKENNAKYDELRQEEEDESQNQNLEANNQIVSKRCLEKKDFNLEKSKKQIEKQRRSIPGNDKVQLHESIRKRSAPKYGGIDVNQDQKKETTETPKLELDSASSDDGKVRLKRSNSRVLRRVDKRRAKNLLRERRLGNLRYRPQNIDDDNDDEGNEFEDDGFDDQTSNLDEASLNSRIERDPGNPVFDNRNYLMRRKRARDLRVSRRKRHQRKRRRKRVSSKNAEKRDNRGTGSSEELNPRLALDYKEAFGRHQRDSNENFARFKRIKRVLRTS